MQTGSPKQKHSDSIKFGDCPKCHQHSLVHRDDVYTCLHCEFRKDVSNPKGNSQGDFNIFIAILIAAALAALIL